MRSLSIAAILLTFSAGIVLAVIRKHPHTVCRMPELLIYLLLDLPLYGILIYLHGETTQDVVRKAVLGSTCILVCTILAFLLHKRKTISLHKGTVIAALTFSLQLFTILYTCGALLYLNYAQESSLTNDICLIIMEHLLLFSMVFCFLCIQHNLHIQSTRSEATRTLNNSLLRIRQKK